MSIAEDIIELQLKLNNNFENYFSIAEKYVQLRNFYDAKHTIKTLSFRSNSTENLTTNIKCTKKLLEIMLLERSYLLR
jgi:hypothetical protein